MRGAWMWSHVSLLCFSPEKVLCVHRNSTILVAQAFVFQSGALMVLYLLELGLFSLNYWQIFCYFFAILFA